jgi:hypothetical protein
MSGDSVVWLLLESGDAKADDSAADTLGKALRRLEREIKLPDQEGESVKLLSKLPLQTRFTVLRVERMDSEEELFVGLLLKANKDLSKEAGPLVFPVFGRGRVLEGIAASEFESTKIDKAANFLCGACSCEVKRLNPGVDLLVAADWDAVLEDRTKIEPDNPPRMAQRVPIPTGRPVEVTHPPETAAASRWSVFPTRAVYIGIVAVTFVIAIITGTLALRAKTKDPAE